MRIARKIYMSIFTTMFILITCVATTFAWVGMFTTSTLGSFDLNLKVVDNKDVDYLLTISAEENSNTFIKEKREIDINKVKRQILENMGKSTSGVLDNGIDELFSKVAIMEPVTTDKDLSNFYSLSLEGVKNKKFFLIENRCFYKFNLYLSVDTPSGISTMTAEELNSLNINANVFFDNIEEALTGTLNTDSLINSNPFSTIPSNSEYSCLKNINRNALTINTKNSTRIAFQTFEPISIDSSYSGNEVPTNTIIYQGGHQLPNVSNDVYDLGGILPEEYNLALKEINSIYDINMDLDNLFIDLDGNGQISNDEKIEYIGAKDRYELSTDLELTYNKFFRTSDNVNSSNYSNYYIYSNGNYVKPSLFSSNNVYYEKGNMNNIIWHRPDSISGTNYLGVQNGIQTKMKISVYFWYEGFDADCLRLIDFRPTSLNIVLASDKNED